MIHKPASPAEFDRTFGTCQHHHIDNDTFRCEACDELMVSVSLTAKTIQSAPNVNPCQDPGHLAAIKHGVPFECNVPYVPGPVRTSEEMGNK